MATLQGLLKKFKEKASDIGDDLFQKVFTSQPAQTAANIQREVAEPFLRGVSPIQAEKLPVIGNNFGTPSTSNTSKLFTGLGLATSFALPGLAQAKITRAPRLASLIAKSPRVKRALTFGSQAARFPQQDVDNLRELVANRAGAFAGGTTFGAIPFRPLFKINPLAAKSGQKVLQKPELARRGLGAVTSGVIGEATRQGVKRELDSGELLASGALAAPFAVFGGARSIRGPQTSKLGKSLLEKGGKEITRRISSVADPVEDATRVLAKQKQLVKQSRQTVQSRLPQNRTGQNSQVPAKTFDDIIGSSGTNVKEKVGLHDFIRTPDRVLEKIGLKKESEFLKQKYSDYLTDLPKEIDRVTAWSKRVSPQSNQRIYKFLDGQDVKLNKNELKVANEIRAYLLDWADKLKLPKDRRITNYITRIFERDFIEKEFDDDVAKIIRDKVPGSVYDPFLQRRLGKLGYVEDTWRALDAYVKRATRKFHMDQALEPIKKKADTLELSQYNYVKNLMDRVNLRPTSIDTSIDNTIKQAIGYRFGARPFTSLTRSARQMVYRATLGINPGTALKNLTQGANTYAKLGEKYTTIGYLKTAKMLATGDDELTRVGVLRDNFIQDRALSATRKFWQNFDRGLFFFFETAEKINRGAAYYGAKSRALSRGKSEKEAIAAGIKMARDTQFTFGSVDTPAVLSGDLQKTFGQFQSFSIKQAEFLSEMVQNKEFLGLFRWSAASLALVSTVGKLIGMEPKDLVPSIRLGVPPTLQLPQEIFRAATNQPDRYGNERDLLRKAKDIGKAGLLFLPGSTQAKKTIGGLKTSIEGFSDSPSGAIRTPVSTSLRSKIQGAIFGESSLPEVKEFFNEERNILGTSQSQLLRDNFEQRFELYQQILDDREVSRIEKEIRDRIKTEGGTGETDEKFFYKDGDKTKSVLKNRDITPPKLSGKAELDKRKIDEYNRVLNAKLNDIDVLHQNGLLSDEQAENQIIEILALKEALKAKKSGKKKSSKGRKPKKIALSAPKKVKFTPIAAPKFNFTIPKGIGIKTQNIRRPDLTPPKLIIKSAEATKSRAPVRKIRQPKLTFRLG